MTAIWLGDIWLTPEHHSAMNLRSLEVGFGAQQRKATAGVFALMQVSMYLTHNAPSNKWTLSVVWLPVVWQHDMMTVY